MDYHSTTSLSLLASLEAQDVRGWKRFADLYAPLVYSWCRRAGVPEADSPDITQQVFLKVFRGISTFRKDEGGGSFRGWLATICRNVVCDFFRNRQAQPVASGGTEAWRRMQLAAEVEWGSNIGSVAQDTRSLAHRALQLISDEFSSQARRAFELVVIEGKSSAEAAAMLGMTGTAVRTTKSRVMRRIREVLGEVK